MKKLLVPSLRCCRKCGRQLPPEAFYYVKQARRSDSYCKECRSLSVRMRRKQAILSPPEEASSGRLNIPLVEDRELRIALILRAKSVVCERARRRRNRMLEEEFHSACLAEEIRFHAVSMR